MSRNPRSSEKDRKVQLNVLAIGFARELWDDPTEAQGDTHERMLGYGRHLESYHVLTHSLRTHRLARRIKVADRCWGYATNGVTRVDSWFRIIHIGLAVSRRFSLDIIHAQDPLFTGSAAYVLSRILRLPYNVSVFGANPFDPYWLQESRLNRFGAPIARTVLHAADGIQVDGSATQHALIESGLRGAKISRKPIMSTAIKKFFRVNRDEGLRQTLITPAHDGWLWLYVGRIVPQKNLRMLLEIAEAMRSTRHHVTFVCIGDGPDLQRLRAETQRRGLDETVKWVGARPHRDVVRYMSACDAFILTSFYEGFARVLMEAGAAGLPIITTAVSGSSDAVIEGESGFITPIDDVNGMIDAMTKLMSNREQARKMGEMGRRHVGELVSSYMEPYCQIKIWEDVCGREG